MSYDDQLVDELAAAAARADRRPIPQRTPIAQLANAVEQAIRLHHMAEPNGHLHGYTRGVAVCRTCIGRDGLPELYPCPTVRAVRRLTRAVEGGRS